MKAISQKKPAKDQREKGVLLGLVELYLETGKPIGSNTLRENGFDYLSSATIRNYFAKLEESGYLKQQHSSGGRIPTPLAYKLYADMHLNANALEEKEKQQLKSRLLRESREVASYLQHAAEVVSESTGCAVFLSAPRFDQDFVLDIKLVAVDHNRCLCVVITDFGLVHTEVLYTENKLSNFSLKRIESYFHWRIKGLDKPTLNEGEEELAVRFYNELILRHIVTYTNFSAEDIYKTGFSRLLLYPDFNNAAALASGLSLFENPHHLRSLLRECCEAKNLSCWIGEDHSGPTHACSILAIPYRINQTIVGSIAILGPQRMPYKRLFGLLQAASEYISETLTRSMYKFKITFREPKAAPVEFKQDPINFLLEDKRS